MKKLLWLLILLCAGVNVFSTQYYVSASGSDLNNGLTTGTPFRTLTKANAVSVAGDIISLNGGDLFAPFVVTKSGNSSNRITYNSYGTGQGVISGFATVSGFTNMGGNVWESNNAVSTLSLLNIVVINGVNTAMGRFPNSGYLAYQSFSGSTSITSSSLNSTVTNWTGAEMVLRVNKFIINRRVITSASAGSITFAATAGGPIKANFGFFIQNDVRTLDAQNEWYYNPTSKKLRIYSTSMPVNVEVPTITDILAASGANAYITYNNIYFRGANKHAVYTTTGDASSSPAGNHITVSNCSFDFTGENAINSYPNTGQLVIFNNTFNHSNNAGMFLGASLAASITFNTVKNTGVFPGMGPLTSISSFMGIKAQGNNVIITDNIIDTTGYDGISWDGEGTIVDRNLVDYYCFVCNDGGGIYTTTSQGLLFKPMRYVRHNIILNGIGATAGTDAPNELGGGVHGLYLDTQPGWITLIGNTVANSGNGLFLNNAHDITMDSNTVYNCQYQTLLNNYVSGVQMFNLTYTNNIWVARTSTQQTLNFFFGNNPNVIPSGWVANFNYYCRPILENTTTIRVQSTNMSLAAFKTFSGADAASQISPRTITNVNQLDFQYNATNSVSVNTLQPGVWVDMRNTSYIGTITLQPYSSAVLINTGTTNIAPTANAGTDQTIQLPTSTVNLVGSGADTDGTIVSYLWTKVSGTGSTITTPNSASTSITGLTGGVYQFKLTVTDNLGAQGSDIVVITVNPANVNPTANAGSDQAVQLPTSTTTLVGSGNDPDGTITGYLWTKLSGPVGGTITSPTTATTGITALQAGTYVFNLRVTDNQGATGNDQVQVIVSLSPNIAPTANAGIDQSIQLPTSSVNLVGSGNDPDGSIVSYAWTQISGAAATITSPSSASTTVTGMTTAGTYQFKLTVTDNGGLTGSDNILITVTPANIPPQVNAGTDQSITAPTSVVTLSGSATDPDGTISSHVWTKISGTGSTITNAANYTTTVTGLSVSTYVFRLTATDNQSLTGFDEVTVIVNPAINTNPTANAGADQVLTWPTNSTTVNGSSSSDPDGSIVAYTWTRISGTGTISNPNSVSTTITGLSIGVSVFQLLVADNSGATATDNMQITVNQGSATVSATVTSKQFTGAPLTPTVVTNPVGIATATTLNGVGGGQINAATYSAVSGITDPNWTATPISYSFTITKKPGSITVTNLLQPYNGSQRPVSVSTSDPFTTETRYDGSLTPSSTAGSHTAITINTNSNYQVTPDTSILVITQAIPTVSWSTPAAHTYPFALDGTVLNATTSVPGTKIYVPAAGFIPTPGNNTLIVNFTPDDSLNYAKVNGTSVVLVINKGVRVINVIDTIQNFDGSAKFVTAFTTPTNENTLTIVYGDAHTSIGDHTGSVSFSSALYTATTVNFTLHITSNAGSVFITNYSNRVYTGSSIVPTVTTNPPSLPFTLSYNGSPTAPITVGSYPNTIASLNSPNVGADTVTLTIIRATPTASWPQISNGNYPFVVISGMLNASSPVAGIWSYDVNIGDTISVGSRTITGTFTPTDAANYNTVVITNTFTVSKGNASMSFLNTSQTYDGTAKNVIVVTNPLGLTGVAITGTPQTAAGSYPISATMSNANWQATAINGTFTITKSNNYTLSWNNPAPIMQGSRITAAILNPSSTIAGSFSFNYPLNTLMNVPGTFILIGTFTPSDGNYNTKTITVPLSVYGTPFLQFYIDHNIYLNLPNQ